MKFGSLTIVAACALALFAGSAQAQQNPSAPVPATTKAQPVVKPEPKVHRTMSPYTSVTRGKPDKNYNHFRLSEVTGVLRVSSSSGHSFERITGTHTVAECMAFAHNTMSDFARVLSPTPHDFGTNTRGPEDRLRVQMECFTKGKKIAGAYDAVLPVR